MIVVTGAAGHIGNVLIRLLLAQGKKNIRALVLPNESTASLDGLAIEKFEGDITNINSLIQAFKGADQVFHLAGIIAISHGQEHLMHKVNVDGTKNVIKACQECKVKRMLHTSSIHAIKEPPLWQVIDETLPFKPEDKKQGYDRTKAEATLEVLQAVKQGLDAVVVCPSGVIGPYDFRISEMGQLMLDINNGKLYAYVHGAYDFVDVRDVAKGMILVMEKGRRGEVYILSGERIRVGKIIKIIGWELKKPTPKIRLPIWLAMLSAYMAPIYYRITKTKPLFTPYSIHTLASNSNVSNKKARGQLGYSPRPIEESLKDSIKWFKKQGIIK